MATSNEKAQAKVTAPKILLVRRDNIGDLVCTTPLIAALRERHPTARIDLLGNTYNIDVVRQDPRLNNVYAYTKTKHRPDQSAIRTYWLRLRLILELRAVKYDWIILCQTGSNKRLTKWASWLKGKRVVGLVGKNEIVGCLTDPQQAQEGVQHEVERLLPLLTPLGAKAEPPVQRLFVDPERQADARLRLHDGRLLVALHISARRPLQRWPTERFRELIDLINTRLEARVALFWSPGDLSNPTHIGDDQKAAEVLSGLSPNDVIACPSSTVAGLMVDLSAIDLFIGADGGAMHLAAGLGKPVVCLFGDSDPANWHPWGVPSRVLQAGDHDVRSISVATVYDATAALVEQCFPNAAPRASPQMITSL
jgi:ADP-heptose:LPS heptosyltransferase